MFQALGQDISMGDGLHQGFDILLDPWLQLFPPDVRGDNYPCASVTTTPGRLG